MPRLGVITVRVDKQDVLAFFAHHHTSQAADRNPQASDTKRGLQRYFNTERKGKGSATA